MLILDDEAHLAPSAAGMEALGYLRRTRLVRRLGNMSIADAAYRVYVTALISVLAIVMVTGRVGDARLASATMDRLMTDTPGWAGLLVAVALFFGLRSGERGGPIAVEAADVQHLLLAPLQRSRTLGSQTTRLLSRFAMWGAVLGALVGDLAVHRVPGSAPPWVFVAVLFGATTGSLVAAFGLLVAGLRPPKWISTSIGVILVAWATADVTGNFVTSPTAVLVRILVGPRHLAPLGLAPGPLALILPLAPPRCLGGLSREPPPAMERWISGGCGFR